MYEVKSELSMAGSGGAGVTRPHGRNTGMDNDINYKLFEQIIFWINSFSVKILSRHIMDNFLILS